METIIAAWNYLKAWWACKRTVGCDSCGESYNEVMDNAGDHPQHPHFVKG